MPRPTTRLTKLRTIRRWTEEDGRVAVEALRASGLSGAAFAAAHGLHPVRIERWNRRLGATVGPTVVPVDVIATGARAAVAPMEVVLASGTVVRVAADFDESALVRLLRAVERAC